MYSISVISVLLLIQLAASKIISIPMIREKSMFQENLERHGPIYTEKMFRTLMGNTSIPLFKYADSEYYGEALFGHPGQKFKLIFDTAWANAWIPSKLCKVTDVACSIHNQYDHSRSSMYKADGRDFSLNLDDNVLKGFFSSDLLHIGSVNISDQIFAEVTTMPFMYFSMKADGILGLAYPFISMYGIPTVFENLVSQGTISKKIFSLYMNRDQVTSKGGTLFLGGSMKKHIKGNLTYTPVTKEGYWQIEIDGIEVNKTKQFCKTPCISIMDTSSNTISGPAEAIQDLALTIKSREFIMGRYMVNCGLIGHLPAIVFKIGGRDFTLKSRDYVQVMNVEGFSLCLSVFKKNDLTPPFNNAWIIGGAFMARYYTEFDMEQNRIGFADVR